MNEIYKYFIHINAHGKF